MKQQEVECGNKYEGYRDDLGTLEKHRCIRPKKHDGPCECWCSFDGFESAGREEMMPRKEE